MENGLEKRLVAPVLLRLADVGLVAALCSGLTSIVELLSLVGSGLLQREEAYLTLEEVLELVPVGLLAVELEGVLANIHSSNSFALFAAFYACTVNVCFGIDIVCCSSL